MSVSIIARPEFIHDCNCSLCRKAGAAWGYFPSASVSVSGSTRSFSRNDRPAPAVSVQSCKICGCTTHFTLTEAFRVKNPTADQTGVNMRLFDLPDLTGVEVRFPDGARWDGEGPFDYRREPLVIGEPSFW